METELLRINYTLDTIDKAVKLFWETVHGMNILALSGELGAGKTTFIHKLCDYLQVQDTVSSPTFALINEYHFMNAGRDNVIYHLDWYRLKDTEEAVAAGMEDCLLQAQKGQAYCFIEWPEKAIDLLLPPYLWISIDTMQDVAEREMVVKLRT